MLLSSFVSKDIILLEDNIKWLTIPGFAWFILKLFGAFSTSIDDINILEENRYDVGSGLAANCWFSFLEYGVKSNIKEKMQEFTKDIKEAMIGKSEIEFLNFNTQIENFRSFEKLLVLLPDNCLGFKKIDLALDEKIFQHIPGYCDEQYFGEDIKNLKCPGKHKIEFTLPKHIRKDPASLNVYWIFENAEDEMDYQNSSKQQKMKNDKPKIFIVYDFPQLLQSVMGPGKGWEPEERPLARKRNLDKFKKIIQDFIKTDHCVFR